VRLAFADALHLMGVQAVNLAAALTLPLFENGGGLVERPAEDRRDVLVAGDLAGDVADGAAEIGPEPAQGLACPFELFGMGITLMPDQRLLADRT
jgi:hypothetical protein